MGSRENILSAISKNKPAAVALPAAPSFPMENRDLTTVFTESIVKAGGEVIMIPDSAAIPVKLSAAFPGMVRVANFVNDEIESYQSLLQEPAQLEVVVLKGQLGVAENGAIWLHEADCVNRVFPFITQHLALVLHQNSLLGNMHEAYQQLGDQVKGYGVFIAGPSKTADIEQSLVIGAHGAKSLVVFLIGN